MKTINFNTYDIDKCHNFLKNNYGFRGINKAGLCINIQDRNNIDLLRKECEAQYNYVNSL